MTQLVSLKVSLAVERCIATIIAALEILIGAMGSVVLSVIVTSIELLGAPITLEDVPRFWCVGSGAFAASGLLPWTHDFAGWCGRHRRRRSRRRGGLDAGIDVYWHRSWESTRI